MIHQLHATKSGIQFGHLRQLLLALFLFVGLTCPAVAQTTANSQNQRTVSTVKDPLDQYNDSIEALVKKVWPSVVQILVTSYGPRDEGRGNTSGVETGEHRFYLTQKGQKEQLDGIGRFVHIWQNKEGEWKVSRVVSYGFRSP